VQSSTKLLCILSAVVVSFGYSCWADSLVGAWQTEVLRAGVPGRTNTASSFETIEFFQDLTFKISTVIVLDGKRGTNVPFSGTYTMIGTNKFTLKVTPLNLPAGSTPPRLTVNGSIVEGELTVPKFITSVVPEYNRYRRVKR
jgi:hypothetical protein